MSQQQEIERLSEAKITFDFQIQSNNFINSFNLIVILIIFKY